MTYSIRMESREAANGVVEHIYVLQSEADKVRAEIRPALGFNCFKWKVVRHGKALDLLYADPDFFKDGRPTRTGIPILFPYPGRIRDGRFRWEGKTYQLPLTESSGKMSIHGFCCRLPWTAVEAAMSETEARLTGVFSAERDGPQHLGQWPAAFEMAITYVLSRDRLQIEARVRNPDKKPLPFGLGFHPYFRIPFAADSSASECSVQMKSAGYWELHDSLPTGRILPLDASRDLDCPRPYTELKLDDVYTRLPGDGLDLVARGRIHDRKAGTTLSVLASSDYREMVLFTPAHRQAFCLEPYTCVPDAPNLLAGENLTGWKELQPGQSWESKVEFVLEDLNNEGQTR